MREVKDIPAMIKNAAHYKAIGETRIYLYTRPHDNQLDDLPWDHVTEVKPGSMYRYDTAVDLHFSAQHPCGLTFEWSLDIEERDSNGLAGLRIATDRMARILARLGSSERLQMRACLTKTADAIRAQADKSMDWVRSQYGHEAALRALIEDKEPVSA